MVASVAERLSALFLNHLIAVSGVYSSPVLATCETSQNLLAEGSCGFSRGFSRFCPTFCLAGLICAEIILKGTLN